MKRIISYLIIFLVLCCVSFSPAGIYAASEKNSPASPVRDKGIEISGGHSTRNVSNGASLPLGVKSADEKSTGGRPVQNTVSGKLQAVKTDSTRALPVKKKSGGGRALDPVKDTTSAAINNTKESLAELRAYVDKSSITIGDKVTYTLEIDADNDLGVEFPSYVSGLGGFAVKDFGKDEKKIGRKRSRKIQWYLLDTYTTGSYVIPGQSVKIKLAGGQTQVLKSPQIFVEVRSVIDTGKKDAGLKDIKEPLTVKSELPAILIIAFILILLAAAGIILWRFYLKRSAAKKTEPALAPREIAFRELEKIEGLRLIEDKKIKEYYYLVSLALRTYLENRFSLKAPEQTTEEFLESVTSSDKLEGRHINILKKYLNHCDLVKYAKFDPGKAEAGLLAETTRHFIEETFEDRKAGSDNEINTVGT